MSFFKALKETLFTYVPHYNKTKRTKVGGIGLTPWNWFFFCWGTLMTGKHNKRCTWIRYSKKVI